MEISHFWAHVICVLVYTSSKLVLAYPLNATQGEFPFIVYIVPGSPPNLKTSHGCTGTLLSLSWVLSVGACLRNHTQNNITIIAGVTNIGGNVTHQQGLQIRGVDREVVHPDMSGVSKVDLSLQPYPDLILLRTTTPFLQDKLVGPARVHVRRTGTSFSPEEDCVIAGWGYQELNPGWIEWHYLKWTNILGVMQYRDCTEYWLVEFNTQVCAMLPPENITLKGYCGNPIICGGILYGLRHSRTYYNNKHFAVHLFVDILSFVPWIRQSVRELNTKKRTATAQERTSSATKYFAGVVLTTALTTLHCVQWK